MSHSWSNGSAARSSFIIRINKENLGMKLARYAIALAVLFVALFPNVTSAAPAGPDNDQSACLPSLDTQLAALPHGSVLFDKTGELDTVQLDGISVSVENFEDAEPNGAFVFNTNLTVDEIKDETDEDKLVHFGKAIGAFRTKAGNIYDEGAQYSIKFDQPHKLEALLIGDWDHRHELTIQITLDDGGIQTANIIPVDYDRSQSVVRSIDLQGLTATSITFGMSESFVWRLLESCESDDTFKLTSTPGNTPNTDAPVVPASLPKTSLPDGEQGCAVTAHDAIDLPWCDGFAPVPVVFVAITYRSPIQEFVFGLGLGSIAPVLAIILIVIYVFAIRPRLAVRY